VLNCLLIFIIIIIFSYNINVSIYRVVSEYKYDYQIFASFDYN